MKNPLRVLIFPGGTEIGLELRQALAWRKEVELFSAGSAVSNHAPYAFENHFPLPSIYEDDWICRLNELINHLAIDYIFPAYDDVLLALAENARKLLCPVVTSPLETCQIARSKRRTYQHLGPVVTVPRIYANPEEVREFPVFLKPDVGQGSERVRLARNPMDLQNGLTEYQDRLILEYLPGEEFTVDCFSDRELGLLFSQARVRRRTRAGIAVDSEPVRLPECGAFAKAIASHLVLHGAWFFQVKRDRHGQLKLLEVAPRIAGASAVCRVMGVNLPLLSLYEAERAAVKITQIQQVARLDRAFVNRYKLNIEYSTIYVDFDDTLVVRNRVNPELVKLLFQALNRGVRLALITRHEGEIDEALRKHHLEGVFHEVVHLGPRDPKSLAVVNRNAVFIDDSFREREEVRNARGVPVFDVSMIEALLDDRV